MKSLQEIEAIGQSWMLLGEFAREQARDVVLAAIDLLEAAEFQQGNDGWRFSIVAPRANPSDKLMELGRARCLKR